jgi:tetratricopeptide (TPR) repeat protein
LPTRSPRAARSGSNYAELPTVLEEFPLADFPPAHYTVRVSVAAAGAEIVSSTEEFDLSFAESVPRPWFSSRILPPAGDPVYAEIIGAQLFNLGRFDEARVFLETAFQRKPESEDAAANLARVYLALQNPPAVVKTLAPLLIPEKTAKYDVYLLAAEAWKRAGEFGRAIELLDRAVAHYGVNAVLLNSIGECYAGQGKSKEALASFEKSLELSPDQPEVRKRVETLKRKAPH